MKAPTNQTIVKPRSILCKMPRVRRASPEKKEYVEDTEPSCFDVVFGRGGISNHHPGNKLYWEKILGNRDSYRSCRSDNEKTKVAQSIVDFVHKSGGRFLQRDTKDEKKRWYFQSERNVLSKVKQALRDKYVPKWADEKIPSKTPRKTSRTTSRQFRSSKVKLEPIEEMGSRGNSASSSGSTIPLDYQRSGIITRVAQQKPTPKTQRKAAVPFVPPPPRLENLFDDFLPQINRLPSFQNQGKPEEFSEGHSLGSIDSFPEIEWNRSPTREAQSIALPQSVPSCPRRANRETDLQQEGQQCEQVEGSSSQCLSLVAQLVRAPDLEVERGNSRLAEEERLFEGLYREMASSSFSLDETEFNGLGGVLGFELSSNTYFPNESSRGCNDADDLFDKFCEGFD